MSRTGESYALGHSEREIGRLSAQARVFEPFTRRMLQQAGVAEGMRVLDVGSGAGDVALLCATLVGPAGEVIGMDKAPAAVEAAAQRARNAGFENVKFVQGDPSETAFDRLFDAVVGRLVLMHHTDPTAMLRRLTGALKRGGIVAFQEFDIGAARSYPPGGIFEQCLRWISTAFTQAGTDSGMGLKLYGTFIAAGLPGPSMSLDAGIWGGSDETPAVMVSDVVRSLLPALLKFGIATEAEVEIDSLRSRIQQEMIASGGIAISPSLIGAWARLE